MIKEKWGQKPTEQAVSSLDSLELSHARILSGLESSQVHSLELFLEMISSICASLFMCRVDKIIWADSSQTLKVFRSSVKPSQAGGPEHLTQVWSRRELWKSEGSPYDSYMLQETSLVLGEGQVNNYLARLRMPALYLPPWHIVTEPNTKAREDWRIPGTLRKLESSEKKAFQDAFIRIDSDLQSSPSLLKGAWTKVLVQPQRL